MQHTDLNVSLSKCLLSQFFPSSIVFPFPWQSLASLKSPSPPPSCAFCASGQPSSHTPQLAIKHLHLVALWSRTKTVEKDGDREGEGCLPKKQRQTWKDG